MNDKKWSEQGFIDEPTPANTDIKAEIKRMCKEKNAVIMAHYYADAEVQDLADFVGDSLALAQKAATTDADIIIIPSLTPIIVESCYYYTFSVLAMDSVSYKFLFF